MGINKELTEAQRGAILYCRQRGDTIRTIAKTVGCGVITVCDTLKRYAKTGQTRSRKRPGRPPSSNALISKGSSDWYPESRKTGGSAKLEFKNSG